MRSTRVMFKVCLVVDVNMHIFPASIFLLQCVNYLPDIQLNKFIL